MLEFLAHADIDGGLKRKGDNMKMRDIGIGFCTVSMASAITWTWAGKTKKSGANTAEDGQGGGGCPVSNQKRIAVILSRDYLSRGCAYINRRAVCFLDRGFA